MEFQKKARKDRLCILIYVLLIFVCSTLNFATSSSSLSSSLSSSSPSPDTPTIATIEAAKITTEGPQSLAINDTSKILLSSQKPPTIANTAPQSFFGRNRTKKICPGVHVRNDLKSFNQLRGCTIINGPLTIALIANQSHPYESKDFENITFPELLEITDYLLFFRVQGLAHLSTLFPNLAVIRGRQLLDNYALIIYEMMHLQRVALPNLNDILRGSVRIESNPNLCHVSTVHWEAICKYAFVKHFIRDNNARCNNNRCPDNCRPWAPLPSRGNLTITTTGFVGDMRESGAENNRSLFCWSNQLCQESCQDPDGGVVPMSSTGGCCSHQCAGGCYVENRSDQCIACRYVSQRNVCVERCDTNLFEFKGECIDGRACEAIRETLPLTECTKEPQEISNYKAIYDPKDKIGKCQTQCLYGFQEDPYNKNRCIPCDKGKCRKVCVPPEGDKPFMVTNVDSSLKELSGCNVIAGSLEISLKGGKNVLSELESNLQDLEEIGGYLKITRSYPITTLSFLRGLKSINGSELDRGQYSLIIIDNPNLEELFLFSPSDSNTQKRLNIREGTVFAHLNPKLCPNRIEALKTYATVKDWDERDVSIHTNGDKQACNTVNLFVEFVYSSAKFARIRFANFASQMQDPRSLLYYLINYRGLLSGTTTMFEGRDGCNSANDVWQTIEEAPIKTNLNNTEEFQTAMIRVEPATRYALYIKTYTILAGATGALSDMIYFETAPDTPGIPRQIASEAMTNESVTVYWLPPTKPNGNIEYYLFNITKVIELEDSQSDICNSIEVRDEFTEKFTEDEPKRYSFLQPKIIEKMSSETECSTTGKSKDNLDPEAKASLQDDKNVFQDLVIDVVYLKQPCPVGGSNRTVKKRSIGSDIIELDRRVIENTLPRKQHAENSVQFESRVESHPMNQQQLAKINKTSKVEATQKGKAHMIRFNPAHNKTGASVPAKSLNALEGQPFAIDINGLEHFTMYTIEVVACHGEFVSSKAKLSKSYSKCGLAAIAHVRTKPIPEYDRVLQHTIEFYPANETVQENLVTWKKPERPNGPILAYRIRYKLKTSNRDWIEACVNNSAYERDGGFVLQDIIPGSYLFGVRVVTMRRGSPLWSEDFEFEIVHDYLVSPTVLSVLVILTLMFLCLAVASGTYYYQKRKNELIYASVNPDYIQYEPDEWEVDKQNVIIGDQLGTGAFGEVYKGQLITEKGTLDCAIKTVSPASTMKQRTEFLHEATIMKQIDTFHVVRLMGVVSATSPVYVIMEYMEIGDLKKFLQSQRAIYERENKPLVDGIYLMVTQIADGMAYLASKKFVHRDLAARNCMVGANRVVKIADFGLARDIYSNDYYRLESQGCCLPVRWMAPESLKYNIFTSQSDVWSFGIVVWEILTFSAHPYAGLHNSEVVKKLSSGLTMKVPDICPDKLAWIINRCWRLNPDERPSFIEIIEHLLPETEDKFYPNCFYKKPKAADQKGDSIANSIPEEKDTGTESYPLLSWPSQRANGLSNGENLIMRSSSPSSGDTINDKDQLC